MKILLEFDETEKPEIVKELGNVARPSLSQYLQTKIGLAIVADSRTMMKLEAQNPAKSPVCEKCGSPFVLLVESRWLCNAC